MHGKWTKNNKNKDSKLLAITVCLPKNSALSNTLWVTDGVIFLVVVVGDADHTLNSNAEMLWISTEKLYALKLSFLVTVC